MSTICKLDVVVTKDAPFADPVPEGWHILTLDYKTDTATGIKKPSESWMVPKLSAGVLGDQSTVLSAIDKFIDKQQREALVEYAAGDLEALPLLSDVVKLCEEYITDRRGERKGPKQSQLMEWITAVLVPYFAARVEKNLPNQTKEQRLNVVVAYSKKFKLAATRGNRSGNETLSDDALRDIQQRMTLYCEGPEALPKSEERDAFVARVGEHRNVLAKSVQEVTTDMF